MESLSPSKRVTAGMLKRLVVTLPVREKPPGDYILDPYGVPRKWLVRQRRVRRMASEPPAPASNLHVEQQNEKVFNRLYELEIEKTVQVQRDLEKEIEKEINESEKSEGRRYQGMRWIPAGSHGPADYHPADVAKFLKQQERRSQKRDKILFRKQRKDDKVHYYRGDDSCLADDRKNLAIREGCAAWHDISYHGEHADAYEDIIHAMELRENE